MITKKINNWTLHIDFYATAKDFIYYINEKGYILKPLPCVLENNFRDQIHLFDTRRYVEEAISDIKSFDEIINCWYLFSSIPLKHQYRPKGLEEIFFETGSKLDSQYFNTFKKAALEVDRYPDLHALLKKQTEDELVEKQKELSKQLKEIEDKIKALR